VETVISIRPLLAVLVSSVAAGLIIYSGHNPNRREFWTFLAGVIKFLIVVSMFPLIMSGHQIEYTVFHILPGVELAFRVDALGLIFATSASFLWLCTSVYAIGYMRSLKEHAQTRFYACFALALSAAIGVAFARNLFTLFFFYEMLSIVTYPLIIHDESKDAWEAGKKYAIYLMGTAGVFFLPAMLLTYYLTGTLEFSASGLFSSDANRTLLIAIYVLFVAGLAKAGIMPFHNWLPSAMIAPTPVSALLHAVAVVNAGAFSVIRIILYVFGKEMMRDLHLGIATAVYVSITILMASVYAFTRDNLKMRLAYSTVSQLSYMILGVALLSPSGITGGTIHIMVHGFSKITLFFCAGAIYVASGKKCISEMAGIGKQMPYTMAAFAIGAFSIIGMPFLAGFVTKWYLVVGSIQAGSAAILTVILFNAILDMGYFVPVIYRAFFVAPDNPEEMEKVNEAPRTIVVPIMITCAGVIILGFYPGVFLKLASMVAQ